jgi:uncharacterized membrane protein
VRFTFPRWRPALALTLAAGFAVLFIAGRTSARMDAVANGVDGASVPADVSFEQVRSIIDRRCAACHSQAPSIPDFGAPPAGVSFDDPARIRALVARIQVRAVETRTMPLGNRTHMTERERAILARWIERQGGKD